MGTFAGYCGNRIIPKEKREEFTRNILKVFNYGGMVQFDDVRMYGKELKIIKPVELNEDGRVVFSYNYFEDDFWENVVFESDDCYMRSEKIGSNEFYKVIIAAYFLYEVYDEEVGVTIESGGIVNDLEYVGWLNHILDGEYSLKNRFSFWEYYELPSVREQKHYDVLELVPTELRWAVGGIDFSDVCYVRYGTNNLNKTELKEGSYAEIIYQCKESIKCYFGNIPEEYMQKKSKLWDFLCWSKEEREKQEDELKEIAMLSLKLYARVFVYLTCELLDTDFWQEWKELKNNVYTDAIVSQYAKEEVIKEREDAINNPIPKVRTKDFLKIDGLFTFKGTPKELEKTPKYFVSDDDRVFWWDGTDEVILSDKMKEWLEELSKQYEEILITLQENTKNEYDMLKLMFDVLNEANNYYKRIYAFNNMFCEFLNNNGDVRYLTAVLLFEKLVQDNKTIGKCISDVYDWEGASRKVTFNKGRICLKRYLAVMANQELRKMYFGF